MRFLSIPNSSLFICSFLLFIIPPPRQAVFSLYWFILWEWGGMAVGNEDKALLFGNLDTQTNSRATLSQILFQFVESKEGVDFNSTV